MMSAEFFYNFKSVWKAHGISWKPLKKTTVALERGVMIQNLSNHIKKLPLRSLTMQGAVSIEITEIYGSAMLWDFSSNLESRLKKT